MRLAARAMRPIGRDWIIGRLRHCVAEHGKEASTMRRDFALIALPVTTELLGMS